MVSAEEVTSKEELDDLLREQNCFSSEKCVSVYGEQENGGK